MSNSRCFKLLPSQLPVLHPADDQTAGPFRFHPNLPFLVADHRSQLAFGPPIEIFIFSFLQDIKKQSFPGKFLDRGGTFSICLILSLSKNETFSNFINLLALC
jgi:hypothetical protein